MFEEIKKYYSESLKKVEAEAVPFNANSLQQFMGDNIGAAIQSSILGGLTGTAQNAMSLLMTSTGINGSQFVQNMAGVALNGGLSSMTQYAAQAFSPVTQLLQVQPEIGTYAIAGHAADTGSAVSQSLIDAVDDLMNHVSSASAQAETAATYNGEWLSTGPLANQAELTTKINQVLGLTTKISDHLDRNNGLPSLEISQLASAMADVRSSISDSGGTMHVASTKASMDSLTQKVIAVTGHMDRLESIKTGFVGITSTTNLAAPVASGSVLTEYSKMFKGVNSTMTDVLGRIQSSQNTDDILSHLPTIVANTELVNNFVSKPFTGVSMPAASAVSTDVLTASAAHISAATALSAVETMVPANLVSTATTMLTAMQQAMAGNPAGIAAAAAGLTSMLGGISNSASQIMGTMNTFSAANPVSSPLLNQFISGTVQSGMDLVSKFLEQGKIGSGLFKISESETTQADSAIKEVQTLASGITDNNKLISLLAVQSRLTDDKRKHVYAAVSFEEARKQALSQVDSLKAQYADELNTLEQEFGGTSV